MPILVQRRRTPAINKADVAFVVARNRDRVPQCRLSILLLYLTRRRRRPVEKQVIVLSEDDRFALRARELAGAHRLTAREEEILLQLARGRSAAFIADDLVCSPATVRTHTKSIYAKLNVHSKQELIDLFA